MADVKAIVILAFLAALGITLLTLGCALEQYGKWWPMFVLITYFLAPVPSLIARRTSEGAGSSLIWEIMMFVTAFIVVSAYGLPILLARSPKDPPHIIEWGAAGLVMAGNTIVFCTILGFFIIFTREDDGYTSW